MMNKVKTKTQPVKPRIDKRATLIDIGTAIFTQKGFSSTGLDEIVRAAKVPKGSFYYYFSSKEVLHNH